MYAKGEGVQQDDVESYAWMIIASANGDRDGLRLREENPERFGHIRKKAEARAKEIAAEFPGVKGHARGFIE